MATPEDQLSPNRRLIAMRIVHLALLSGLVIFAVIAISIRAAGRPVAQTGLVLTYTALAFTGVCALAAEWVPALLTASQRPRLLDQMAADKTGSPSINVWYGIYASQLIVSASLLIAYLIEGMPASLGLALFLWIMIALKMPSAARIERWIDNQQQLLERNRQARA